MSNRVYSNAKQYMKLLLIWQRILDNPNIPGYDVNSIPNLFHECRAVLFSSNNTSLTITQMNELNKIWRIVNK